MSVNDAREADLDRRLTDWLEADAAPRAPDSLDSAFMEGIAATRQRPAWATTERWMTTEARAQLRVMPRAAAYVITILLLAALVVGGLALAGSLTRGGDGGPLGGLTYSTGGVIYMLTGDRTGEPLRLTDDGEFATNPYWSPDGTRFAYESWAGRNGPITLMVRNADGSHPVAVSEPFEPPRGIKSTTYAWSPDSSSIVFWAPRVHADEQARPCERVADTCGQRIWRAVADDGEPARVIGDPELDARSPVWMPGGESIIFAGSTGVGQGWGLYRMDADGMDVQRVGDLASDNLLSFDQVTVSPDGMTVAVSFGGEGRDVILVDLTSGAHVAVASGGMDDHEPHWSPVDSLVAFTNWDIEPRPMLYDTDSGEVVALDVGLWVTGWSPNGGSLVGSGPDGTLVVVDVTDPSTPVVTTVEGVTDAEPGGWRSRP